MLTTKFDLYRTEWLDLVFSNRNKNYGAYELRQNYASNMLKAMGITFLGVGIAIAVISFVNKPVIQPPPILGPNERVIEVPILQKPIEPAKPVTPEKPAAAVAPAAKPAAAVKTSVIPTNVVSDKPTIEPPKIEGLTGAIGSTQIDGPVGGDNIAAGIGTAPAGTGVGKGTGDGTETGTGIYDFNAIEVLPEPVGGKEAWSKFLQKNLRYPRRCRTRRVERACVFKFHY